MLKPVKNGPSVLVLGAMLASLTAAVPAVVASAIVSPAMARGGGDDNGGGRGGHGGDHGGGRGDDGGKGGRSDDSGRGDVMEGAAAMTEAEAEITPNAVMIAVATGRTVMVADAAGVPTTEWPRLRTGGGAAARTMC
jgi:hypothetical protein